MLCHKETELHTYISRKNNPLEGRSVWNTLYFIKFTCLLLLCTYTEKKPNCMPT